MATSYEPSSCVGHTPVLVNDKLYLWGGLVKGLPRVHDGPEKRRFLSSVDVFEIDSGEWVRQETSGAPPLGVSGYCCAAVGDSLYYYGGYCGHDECYHNSVHKLSTSSMQWTVVPPYTQPPTEKRFSSSCMVAFRDGEEDLLYVVGSKGPDCARYYQQVSFSPRVFEQHIFSLITGKWSAEHCC